jgi:hypothetical protein
MRCILSSDDSRAGQGTTVERIADDLFEAVEQALAQDRAASISDEAAQKIMTAAVKLFHRKSTAEGRAFLPVISEQALTPTEAVQGACELIRAVNLNPFDLALWYSRPRPGGAGGGSPER